MMVLRRMVVWIVPLLLVSAAGLRAQAAPKLASIFPLGGQRGTTVDVEIDGTGLEGSNAVWLGPETRLESGTTEPAVRHTRGDGIAAHVTAIKGGARATMRLDLAADARVGFHNLSLVAPGGVSNSVSFWVGPDAVITEAAASHNAAETAQSIKLPSAVNGRIPKTGDLAYYTFDISQEQTLVFEVVSFQGSGFDPQLALYEAGGSFLDPRRSKRLLFHEEITQGGMPANRRMTHHFTKPGRYVVSIGNLFGQGGKGFSYLLRIVPTDRIAEPEDALTWARRRLTELRARSVNAPAIEVKLVKSAEILSLPAVVEGTVGHPGEIDRYRFRAKAGQKLAFEVQTPRASPPYFNLRLDVLDTKGNVVLTNTHVQDGKIGTVDAKVIQVSADLLGKLDQDGEYTLRVRDVTSMQGSADHVYRVLVRPEIPHIGEARLLPEGPVNLSAGARQRLTLSAPGKEEYAGTPALSVEGLPPGVRAFVGANGTTIDLVADAKAPATLMPQVVSVFGLPTMGEKSGTAFLVAEIPVMVVKR